MADESAAISNLRALREAVVTKRRQAAAAASALRNESLLGTHPDEDAGSAFGADLRELQAQIEAIDAAISDEQRIEVEETATPSYNPPPQRPRGIA